MIGGCSSHNGMVFARGHKEDFDRWSATGLTNWSYEKVLPYFKKLETWSQNGNYRGKNGPLRVNKSKIDKCESEILEFVNKKKIEIVER